MSFTSSKIVLGHPISGALYAYFDEILNNGGHIKSTAWHGYYKTLYGNHFKYYMDIAIALSLIYETIILSEADNSIPDREKYSLGNEYYNPDFGLYLCSSCEIIHYDFLDEKVRYLLEDQTIKQLLSSIPKSAHELIIRQVYLDLELANKYNAPLFTFGIRQDLAKRVAELEKFRETEFSENHEVKIVGSYLEITSLLFHPMDIDAFYYLKSDKELRQYASSFQNLLENFIPEGKDIHHDLLLNIKEAMEKDSLKGKISGIFRGGSTILDYVSLIPGVNAATSLVGMGADLAATGIDKFNNSKWYEFASRVEKTMSMEKIHRQLKDVK